MTNLFDIPHRCVEQSSSVKATEKDFKSHYILHTAAPYEKSLQTLYSLRVRNHSGVDVLIRDRSNVPKRMPSAPHPLHATLDIFISLDISAYELEEFKRLCNLESIDPNLRAIIRDVDDLFQQGGGSCITYTQCIQIPASRVNSAAMDGGLFVEQFDLHISRADSNEMQFHPLSGYMSQMNQREKLLDFWSDEFRNVNSFRAQSHDKDRKFLYRATSEGVQVLRVSYNPHEPVEFVEVVRPKVYTDVVPNSAHGEQIETELFQYPFSEITDRLGIYLNQVDAVAASVRMRQPQQVVEVLRAQTDVRKSENDVRKEEMRSNSLQIERELENTTAFNKGVTETIKTLGAIAGGIAALVGLYKLVRG